MTSKYDPLHDHLAALARRGDDSVQLGFDEIDALVGGLPSSARFYREWWANSSQQHCWAWREAGWTVAMVSATAVRFEHDRCTPAAAAEMTRAGAADRGGEPAIDPRTLPPMRETEVRVSLRWRDAGVVALDSDGEIVFPRLPPVAGLYEMTFAGVGELARPRVYIGESDNLRRRVMHYRNPGPTQDTNLRLNAAIKSQLAASGGVRLAIATEAQVVLDGAGGPQPLDLAQKPSRLLAESAELVVARAGGAVDIENL